MADRPAEPTPTHGHKLPTPWEPTPPHDASLPHFREVGTQGCRACERGIDPTASEPTPTSGFDNEADSDAVSKSASAPTPTPPVRLHGHKHRDPLNGLFCEDREPTPTGADRPTTAREVAERRYPGNDDLSMFQRRAFRGGAEWAEARQQPQPLDVDVLRHRAAQFVAEHWRDEAMRDPQAPIMWGAVAHACAMVLTALDGETDPAHLGISESKHGDFRARLSSDPARPSPTEETSDAS